MQVRYLAKWRVTHVSESSVWAFQEHKFNEHKILQKHYSAIKPFKRHGMALPNRGRFWGACRHVLTQLSMQEKIVDDLRASKFAAGVIEQQIKHLRHEGNATQLFRRLGLSFGNASARQVGFIPNSMRDVAGFEHFQLVGWTIIEEPQGIFAKYSTALQALRKFVAVDYVAWDCKLFIHAHSLLGNYTLPKLDWSLPPLPPGFTERFRDEEQGRRVLFYKDELAMSYRFAPFYNQTKEQMVADVRVGLLAAQPSCQEGVCIVVPRSDKESNNRSWHTGNNEAMWRDFEERTAAEFGRRHREGELRGTTQPQP